MNLMHGTRLLISVRRMYCVMLICIIQTHKTQSIFTSTDGLGNSTNVVLQKTIDGIIEETKQNYVAMDSQR